MGATIFVRHSSCFLESLRAAPSRGKRLVWRLVFHVLFKSGFSFVPVNLCACSSGGFTGLDNWALKTAYKDRSNTDKTPRARVGSSQRLAFLFQTSVEAGDLWLVGFLAL